MIDRVITLTEVDGLPVIPVANHVTEQADGHFSAHGPEELAPKGALNKRTHRIIARLWRATPGVYAVAVDPVDVAAFDPTGIAKTMADYGETPAAATWPCKNKDGSCVISSTTGPDDPRPVKEHPKSKS